MAKAKDLRRCTWAENSTAERDYHDTEWGVPLHEDRALFEFLCLEGAQAGLSWRTVLEKRPHYREVFENFDIEHCARLSDAQLARHLKDPGLIRNRLKIHSIRDNARAALEAIEAFGSLDALLWSYVDGEPIVNRWRRGADVPATTTVSESMSKDLKRRGFRFVGPTICYAHMQATGMVNDHLLGCFRHAELAAEH